MEQIYLNIMADARNVKIVDDDLNAINGLFTLFKAVPCEIYIKLFNLDGTPYTYAELDSRVWSFVIADDYNNKTAPQLRADKVEVLEDGIIKVTISEMNTTELNAVLGEEKAIRLGAELFGKLKGETKDNWVMQWNCSVRNRRDSAGEPTGVISDYYTKAEVDSIVSEIPVDTSNFYTKAEVDEKLDNITIDTTDFYNKTEVDSALSLKANISELTKYQLKADAFTGDYNDLSNKPVIPTVDVDKKYVDDGLALKLNISDAFSGDYNDLANKPVIPVVPENITTQGNVFNGTNQLVKTDDTGKIPDNLYVTGLKTLDGYVGNTESMTFDGLTITSDSAIIQTDENGIVLKTGMSRILITASPYLIGARAPEPYSNILVEPYALTLYSGEVININTDRLMFNNSELNTANGLVRLNSKGKIPTSLYDKTEVDLTPYALKSEIPDVSAFITADALTPYALKTELPVVDVDKAYVDAELAKKLNTADAFSGSYNDLADKPTIPVLPENITTLGNSVNVAGGLVQIAEDGKIPADLYDSGSGGTTYTAGSGINIADNVINVDLDGYQTSYVDIYIQSSYAHLTMYDREFQLGKKTGNGRIYSANNCEDINIKAGTLFLGGDIKAGNMYLNTKNYSKGTVETSCSVSYSDGNFCTLKLATGTACTLTISYIPAYATLMVIVDNSNAGSLLFGSEEVISTAETGEYALVFSNFGSAIKLYNKIEV